MINAEILIKGLQKMKFLSFIFFFFFSFSPFEIQNDLETRKCLNFLINQSDMTVKNYEQLANMLTCTVASYNSKNRQLIEQDNYIDLAELDFLSALVNSKIFKLNLMDYY